MNSIETERIVNMMKFKRVVIKISGEALAGEKKTGFDFELISRV